VLHRILGLLRRQPRAAEAQDLGSVPLVEEPRVRGVGAFLD